MFVIQYVIFSTIKVVARNEMGWKDDEEVFSMKTRLKNYGAVGVNLLEIPA